MNDLHSSIFIKSCFVYDINNFFLGGGFGPKPGVVLCSVDTAANK